MFNTIIRPLKAIKEAYIESEQTELYFSEKLTDHTFLQRVEKANARRYRRAPQQAINSTIGGEQ